MSNNNRIFQAGFNDSHHTKARDDRNTRRLLQRREARANKLQLRHESIKFSTSSMSDKWKCSECTFNDNTSTNPICQCCKAPKPSNTNHEIDENASFDPIKYKVGRRLSGLKARKIIRGLSETKQTQKKAKLETAKSKRIKALKQDLNDLISKAEAKRDAIMEDIYSTLDDNDEESGKEDEDSDQDDEDDDLASSVIRDIVTMNNWLNKLEFNRLVLNVTSVRNRTITRRVGDKEVLIDIGHHRFFIHCPPYSYKNDFVSLLKLYGVQVDDETAEQGVQFFDMDSLDNEIKTFRSKYVD
eukprot:340446_1